MAKRKTESKLPALSVIIAMYNTEEYIQQCLESLLSQTFQDFEVIIVDDCSTDKSVDVVKKIAPMFNGRLLLQVMKKNSGCPGIPRNVAMRSAKGKYITFLDSDDFFTNEALEILYHAAENFDADVVHLDRSFIFNDGKKDFNIFQWMNAVDSPTLETENLGERVTNFINKKTSWWACNKIFKRKFLTNHDITFTKTVTYEDFVFAFKCLINAKVYLRIPNVVYFYRRRKNSITATVRDIAVYVTSIINVVKSVDAAMCQMDFFKENPNFRYSFIEYFVQDQLNLICQDVYVRDKMEPFQLDKILRDNVFSKISPENGNLMSYFFTAMVTLKTLSKFDSMEIENLKAQVADLQQKLSERTD